jgi:hypothetical protein
MAPATPPSGTQKPSTVGRKRHVDLGRDEKAALLVQICITHFARYSVLTQKAFFLEMQTLYKEATGNDVDVKGYMARWTAARIREKSEGVLNVYSQVAPRVLT